MNVVRRAKKIAFRAANTHDRQFPLALPVGSNLRLKCEKNQGSCERLVVSYLQGKNPRPLNNEPVFNGRQTMIISLVLLNMNTAVAGGWT